MTPFVHENIPVLTNIKEEVKKSFTNAATSEAIADAKTHTQAEPV